MAARYDVDQDSDKLNGLNKYGQIYCLIDKESGLDNIYINYITSSDEAHSSSG